MIAVVLALGLLLQSCASPGQQLLLRGAQLGFTHRTFNVNGFKLEAFTNQRYEMDGILHVYLEGDGLPWSSITQIAADPTSRNPLMLRLMALDRSPSLYLGRPCYNGHAQDTGCSSLLWTYRRYAPEVLAAMSDALTDFLNQHRYSGLVLLGHSGGGALALLLAQRFPSTRAVVTLAGNSDIDAWADLHGYDRLQGSLNPADSQGGKYIEMHYLGDKDGIIPPSVFQPILRKRPHAQIIVIPGFDHVCCWDTLWPKILGSLQ